ncbi:MAG: ankyrin repeat domain-containing protein, partial [Dehalococcoidia bacterium]|nr:ankyrin repeat domain-containing protein [Dehalococcoidia bacterium]
MNAPDKDLLDSITVNSAAGVEEAIKAGADVNAPWHRDITPLQRAAAQPLVVEQLLKAGADPNARDHRGHTPLHNAAMIPRETSGPVRLLLDAGADPAARDELGNLPLHYAAAHPAEGRAKAVGYLIHAHDSVQAV